MRTLAIALAFLGAMSLGAPWAALADPLPTTGQDGSSQSTGDDDHVVGEEMCARPG